MITPLIVLLFGKDGQVGWALRQSLGNNVQVVALGRNDCDLLDIASVRAIVHKYKPHVIINAAAYTAVDQAEKDQELAQILNSVFVGVLAELSIELNCWLIHYSTDYVFDGNKASAYEESDLPAPLSFYGQSKFSGEQAIQACGGQYLIFRSSWVYSARRNNFPLAILKKSMQQDTLEVVCDSIGAPTPATLIAAVTTLAVESIANKALTPSASGIYHLTSSGCTSWFDYAKFLVTQAHLVGMPLKLSAESIIPVPQSSFQSSVIRPNNSQLNTAKLCCQFNIILPDWRDQLILWLSTINYKDL